MFARVKVPPLLPRFLTVSPNRFVPLEDVIAAHLDELFAGLDVIEHHAFRVTRIRDLEIDEDVTENLLQSLERELMRRRFEPAVRLEVEESISSDVLDKLVTELDIDPRAVYRLPGPLDLSGPVRDRRPGPAPAEVPGVRARPRARCRRTRSVFSTLSERDVLVHHAVRLVHRERAAAGGLGRGRPPGAGDQAHAVPDQRRLGDRGRAHRRGRGGQAGRGRGRDQGQRRRARPTSPGRASWRKPAAMSSTASSG